MSGTPAFGFVFLFRKSIHNTFKLTQGLKLDSRIIFRQIRTLNSGIATILAAHPPNGAEDGAPTLPFIHQDQKAHAWGTRLDKMGVSPFTYRDPR